MQPMPDALLTAAGLALFAWAALQDVGYRLVANRIPLAIGGFGLALRLLTGSLGGGLVAFVAIFAVAAACWRRGWMGGADVKLFGAGALLVQPAAAAGFVLATCLAGGVLAAGYWLAGRLVGTPSPHRPLGLAQRFLRVECRRLRRGGPLPYAVAIAVGVGFTIITNR